MSVSEADVRAALARVVDPNTGKDLSATRSVKSVKVEGAKVSVEIELGYPGKSQFEPIRITGRLWIVPSWHAAPDPAAINIELDPGMAFGTGSHPTTRLCLEWLCEAVTPGCSVLDYGCGSGILGIAAGLLGAGNVLGVDIDDKAIEAARDNAARNRVAMQVQHSGEALDRTFDVVVANILTNPLCVLAPAIAARVATGGRVALSGVLETQAGQVIAAWQSLRKASAFA